LCPCGTSLLRQPELNGAPLAGQIDLPLAGEPTDRYVYRRLGSFDCTPSQPGITFLNDREGHPNTSRYMAEGFEILTLWGRDSRSDWRVSEPRQMEGENAPLL